MNNNFYNDIEDIRKEDFNPTITSGTVGVTRKMLFDLVDLLKSLEKTDDETQKLIKSSINILKKQLINDIVNVEKYTRSLEIYAKSLEERIKILEDKILPESYLEED